VKRFLAVQHSFSEFFGALWRLGAGAPVPHYGRLFRPELKPGMLEDMVLEEDREVRDDIGALIETAREEWTVLRETADRVAVALVDALDLTRARRKAPVLRLSLER